MLTSVMKVRFLPTAAITCLTVTFSCDHFLILPLPSLEAETLTADSKLHLSSNAITVGDTVTINITAGNGEPLGVTNELFAGVRIEPPGILEATNAPGEFVAVSAGMAKLTLHVSSAIHLSEFITVSCPKVANTQVIHHENQVITGHETWAALSGTHFVEGELLIEGGVLTIDACTEILMGAESIIVVGRTEAGQIHTLGSADEPIFIRGVEAWQGIRLHLPNAEGSSLRGVVLEGATGIHDAGSEHPVIDVVGSPERIYPSEVSASVPFELQSVTVRGCPGLGLRLRNVQAAAAALEWTNIDLRDCTPVPVSVDAASLGAVPDGMYPSDGHMRVIGGRAGVNYQEWRNFGIPYLVENDIVIAAPAIDQPPLVSFAMGGLFVSVAPGVELRFQKGSGIYVGGSAEDIEQCSTDDDCSMGNAVCHNELRLCFIEDAPPVRFLAQGSLHNPIRFTSSQADPMPGDWKGITYLPNATLVVGHRFQQYFSGFRGAIIEYAGEANTIPHPHGGFVQAAITVLSPIPFFGANSGHWLISGTTVRYTDGYGIYSPLTNIESFGPGLGGILTRVPALPVCFCDNHCGDWSPPVNTETAGEEQCLSTNPCPCVASLTEFAE